MQRPNEGRRRRGSCNAENTGRSFHLGLRTFPPHISQVNGQKVCRVFCKFGWQFKLLVGLSFGQSVKLKRPHVQTAQIAILWVQNDSPIFLSLLNCHLRCSQIYQVPSRSLASEGSAITINQVGGFIAEPERVAMQYTFCWLEIRPMSNFMFKLLFK